MVSNRRMVRQRTAASRHRRKPVTSDHGERDEHEDHCGAETGDDHDVEALTATPELLYLSRGPGVDPGEKLLDGPHDLGLRTGVFLTVEEPSREIHVGLSRAGEASVAVGEPPFHRVYGSRLDRHECVGPLLSLLQQGELVIGEMCLAHQVLEGYRPSVAARRLA